MRLVNLMRSALSKKDLEAKNSVVKAAEAAEGEEKKTEPQSYTEQILKYLPAEVIAFYIPALTVAATLKPTTVGAQSTSYNLALPIIFLIALIGTFVYMRKNAKEALTKEGIDNVEQRSILKAAISTLAFFIWAFYLGGTFAGIEGYATYGTLGILGFTFLTPAIYDSIPIPFPTGTKSEQNTPPPQQPEAPQ